MATYVLVHGGWCYQPVAVADALLEVATDLEKIDAP
jgi:hypothetical protein